MFGVIALAVLLGLGALAWIAALWVCMRRHRDEWEGLL